MKNTNSLFNIFFLSLICLIPFSGAQADDIYLSEGLSCDQFLDKISVNFDIDEEGGAIFEKYVNINNRSEVGYRSCTQDCSIILAGKCKAPDLTCDDFQDDVSCNVKVNDKTIIQDSSATCSKDVQLLCSDFQNDVSCNVKIGDKSIVQNNNALCSVDVPLACKDYLDTVKLKFDVDTEDGVICENGTSSELGYTVDPVSCKVTVEGKCKVKSTPTQKPTSTPTATPTVTVPEPVFTPTPAIESACDFYTGSYTPIVTKKGKGGVVDQILKYEEGSRNLSCLTDIIDEASEGECLYKKGTKLYDDCIVGVFYYKFNLSYGKPFYLDKNCKKIQAPVGVKCGEFILQYLVSPISLVLDKDFDINSDLAFVNFDLDPGKQNTWYTWKASNKAPLLVYDPEHTGRVDSAYQLFGDWTFGGKQSASLQLQENFIPSNKWENGFEALASLDRDFDGKLTGEELNELALWFDGNRDAISQPGEVVPLVDTGVTTLFVNGYKKDSNGDLKLDLGYERKVGDEIIQGASIDWYGNGANSKREIVEGYRKSLSKDYILNQESTIRSDKALKSNIEQIDISEFVGVWDYYFDGEEKYATPDGYLILGEGDEVNSIEGHSIAERIFKKSPGNKYNSYVGIFKLSGFVGMSAENDKIISFSILRDNLVDYTRVMLSSDKNTLKGTTTIELEGGLKVATYNWSAVRHKK